MDGRTDGWMEQRKALYGIRKISQRWRHWSMVLKGDVQCAGQRGMEKNRSKKDAPELRNGDAGSLGNGSEVPTISFGEGPDPALQSRANRPLQLRPWHRPLQAIVSHTEKLP